MIAKWEELSRDTIAAIDKEKAIVLFPTAATEQHGPHLPVGTDHIILKTLTDRFIAEAKYEGEADIIFAPQMPIGKSNEHMDFAGTLTFAAKTYYSLIYDVVKSIRHHGFKKIVLFNSHGGNTDMMNLIARDIRIDFDMDVFVFDWWFTPFWRKCLDKVQESGMYGVFHACELETSLMLAARPDLVRMELAVDEDPSEFLRGDKYVTVFGPINAGWRTKDVTKSGVIGAPTFATAEKGEILFDYAVKELVNIISEIEKINY